jgi:nitroreductase
MKNALEAMYSRRSIREFEDELVPDVIVREVVKAAGQAPSSKNTQPWQLFLIQGEPLQAIKADYLAAFDSGMKPGPMYRYSPDPLPAEWMSRARACGIGIFQHKGIGRDDKAKRLAHDRENFHFFGARQVFFLGTRASTYSYGTFLDCGFLLDNLMLGFAAQGYGSCPQYSAVSYPEILRKHIPGSEDFLFICALPIGRPKAGSHVNEFQPTRLPVDDWFKVIG